MVKSKTPGTLPWIRTKDTILLISAECGQDPIEMDQRLLAALAGDLVRCQAGSAIFDLPSGSDVKRNWPVPCYIWQQKGGVLLLANDRFTAPIAGNYSAVLAKDSGIVGATSLTLLELKIHEDELRKHFQLPARPKRAPMSKSNAIEHCKNWLPKEFEKDPHFERRKDDFAEMALAKYGGRVTRRGFDKVWAEVTAHPAHEARGKGGRPKGS